MRFASLFLALTLFAGHAAAQAQLSQLTAAQVGVNGAALSGSPESAAMSMLNQSSKDAWNQLTLDMTVTAGTSTTLTVTCKGTSDGTNYRAIQRCADGTTMTCTAKTWSYDLTAQTSFLLNLPTNYVAVKCTFSAAGTGTIVVRAVRGRI